ncbi:hypothetical protein IDVR_28950 [Intrasporangium sp. DVR]
MLTVEWPRRAQACPPRGVGSGATRGWGVWEPGPLEGTRDAYIGGVYLPSTAVQPPSTKSWVPVTNDAASDAR